MSFSEAIERQPLAVAAEVTSGELRVKLADGRGITVPLEWYPRLLHGNARERASYEFIGKGEGIHWPLIDEDISVKAILAGQPSAESKQSLQRWLASRA